VSIEPEELITPEGAPFAIEQVSTPPTLYPGSGPESLELRLINFASEPVTVTSLSVSLVRAPPGCGSENFELIPADVSPSDPIVIAAGSSLELPAQGASPPQIGLRELPVNQDACQGAELQLSFSGSGQR
jgi:hypothetical protein